MITQACFIKCGNIVSLSARLMVCVGCQRLCRSQWSWNRAPF